MQRPPLAQHNAPAREASVTKTPSGGNVHPIVALNPYQNRYQYCFLCSAELSLKLVDSAVPMIHQKSLLIEIQ